MPQRVCAWFTRASYPAHFALDPQAMHSTFDEWLRSAEDLLQQMKTQGIIMKPVVIEPEEFAEWCAANGHKTNGAARAEFVTIVATRSSQH